MARPKNPVPAYLLHKATGKARVRLKNGSRCRDVYLDLKGLTQSFQDNPRQDVSDWSNHFVFVT